MYDSGREFRFGLLIGFFVASIISLHAYGWSHHISMLVTGITIILCIPYVLEYGTVHYARARATLLRERHLHRFQSQDPSDRKQRIARQTHLHAVEDNSEPE